MRSIGWFARVGITATVAALAGSVLAGQRASEAVRTPDGRADLQGVWRVPHHHATRAPGRVRGQAVSNPSGGERVSGAKARGAQSRYQPRAGRPEWPIGERVLVRARRAGVRRRPLSDLARCGSAGRPHSANHQRSSCEGCFTRGGEAAGRERRRRSRRRNAA